MAATTGIIEPETTETRGESALPLILWILFRFEVGLHQRLGTFVFLTALRDDSQAVVFEVLEAVSTALDELHLSMEALGDAVGFGEAPHADDGFVPVGERLGEGDEGGKAAGFEGFNEVEQLRDQLAGLAGVDVFGSHELVGFLHLFVEGFEGWMISEEALESGLLAWEELVGMSAESG